MRLKVIAISWVTYSKLRVSKLNNKRKSIKNKQQQLQKPKRTAACNCILL